MHRMAKLTHMNAIDISRNEWRINYRLICGSSIWFGTNNWVSVGNLTSFTFMPSRFHELFSRFSDYLPNCECLQNISWKCRHACIDISKNEWRINYHLMDRYAAVAPDLARTIECQSAIWRALSVSRFRGSRFFLCQTLLIQGRDALDLVRPGKGHASEREDHGGPITSSWQVITNPESTKLDFFSMIFVIYTINYIILLMDFHLRIKVDYKNPL